MNIIHDHVIFEAFKKLKCDFLYFIFIKNPFQSYPNISIIYKKRLIINTPKTFNINLILSF